MAPGRSPAHRHGNNSRRYHQHHNNSSHHGQYSTSRKYHHYHGSSSRSSDSAAGDGSLSASSSSGVQKPSKESAYHHYHSQRRDPYPKDLYATSRKISHDNPDKELPSPNPSSKSTEKASVIRQKPETNMNNSAQPERNQSKADSAAVHNIDLDDIPLPDEDISLEDIPSPEDSPSKPSAAAKDSSMLIMQKLKDQQQVSEESQMDLSSSDDGDGSRSGSTTSSSNSSSDGCDKASGNSYSIQNIQVNSFTPYQKYIYESMPSRIILRHRKSKEGMWGDRAISEYNIARQIGEGTYGMVYLAEDLLQHKSVALKKVRCEQEKDGFPIFVIREIKILKQLRHRNIIELMDVIVDRHTTQSGHKEVSFYLAFEYMNHDLMGYLESCKGKPVNSNQVCYLMKQLLEGVAHCHQRGFMHRDLKCSNILMDNRGVIKLADFGLSRPYQRQSLSTAEDRHHKFGVNSTRPYTNKVITLWYRPPELLLGSEHYTPAVDMWSLGCILAEMFLLKPLFNANTEVGMLDVIFKMCGTPNPSNWQSVTQIPTFNAVSRWKQHKRVVIDELRSAIEILPLDLLDKMLTLDPSIRISSTEAIQHEWIAKLDAKCIEPFDLPEDANLNEMMCKKERKNQKIKIATQ